MTIQDENYMHQLALAQQAASAQHNVFGSMNMMTANMYVYNSIGMANAQQLDSRQVKIEKAKRYLAQARERHPEWMVSKSTGK